VYLASQYIKRIHAATANTYKLTYLTRVHVEFLTLTQFNRKLGVAVFKLTIPLCSIKTYGRVGEKLHALVASEMSG
jgi:hypothetical protein